MVTPAEFDSTAMNGLWRMHRSRTTLFGRERFRRRSTRHIAFDGPRWTLFETGRRSRLTHRVGASQGLWQTVDLDGRALLVLTVQSYRPSAVFQAILESNYGYSGGSMVVQGATAKSDSQERRMRAGEALMYFLPVNFVADELIVALPSDGPEAPRQRWLRVQEVG